MTPQHLLALEKANKVNRTRAQFRRDLKELPVEEGREKVARLILEPGDLWASAKLHYVLRMPRRSSWAFTWKMLAADRHPLSTEKTLGSLTERQRLVLARAIRGEA